ncbi:MAG: TonB-dependent receptor [Rikenellaceae bacterium]|nr:TonB-dependent receptor [Rikenellaceae bacterium]
MTEKFYSFTKAVVLRMALVLAFVSLAAGEASAQSRKISGTVKDSMGPVVAASVVVEGTTIGVSTATDGTFTMEIPASAKQIKVSYVGYKDAVVDLVAAQTVYDILLEETSTHMDEVVVVGYGTVKRRDVVGSVSSVSNEQLVQMPVATVTEALAGRMAGVQVTSTEGDPDAEIKIRVRGGGSITQDNSPLYIVDGFPVESISDIPASDIQSIDVLKDAFSTAIYGARGANGVVIVTTKSGEKGRVTVNYNAYYGIKKMANTDAITPMNPYQYAQYYYEMGVVRNKLDDIYTPVFGGFEDLGLYQNVAGNDWVDQVFGRTGTTFNHNISVSGGGDKFKWTASYAHIDEDAIMEGSSYKRNNLALKASYKPTKRIGFDFNIRYSDTEVRGAGANSINDAGSNSGNGRMRHAVQYMPIPLDMSAAGGNENEGESNYTMVGDNVQPMIAIADNDNLRTRKNWTANAAFSWEIIDDLTLRVEAGLDDYRQINNRFYGMTSYYVYNNNRPGPALRYTDYSREKIRSTNTLSYDFKKVLKNENHKLNILVGQEYIVSRSNTLGLDVHDYPTFFSAEQAWNMMSAATGTHSVSNVYNPDDRLLSFFGRVNYDYKGKYMISATMRADGSSKFAEGNQWGYFPSAAASWRISGEEWMKSAEWLDNLKIRYSFGTAGNNNIPAGLIFQTYASYGDASDRLLSSGYWGPSGGDNPPMMNPDLKWETTYSHNLGLDFGFLRGRINGSVEIYQNNTQDLLIKYPTGGSGYAYQYRNLGETRNRGIELSAQFVILEKEKYGITFSANASYNQNRVMDLGEGVTELNEMTNWASTQVGTDYVVRVGEPLGQMYGYMSDGRYEVDDFNYDNGKWVLKDGVADNSAIIGADYLRPGAMKLKDLNGDGKVNDSDKTVIGNSQPEWTGGFSLSAYFYGFDLAANFNWVYGNQIYNADKIQYTTSTNNPNYRNLIDLVAVGNRWTNIDWATGLEITDPAALAAANRGTTMWSPYMQNSTFTDWAVEDGSFLRLSSLTLGYTLPKAWMKKLRIQKFRVYVTGTNLFCWTGYSGYDPEVDCRRQTPLTPGVDYSAYPKSTGVVFGANLTF